MTDDIDDDPWALTEPERDQWGRPKIIQTKRNGDPDPRKVEAYTRVSTFAGYLADKSSLGEWQAMTVALGLGHNDDLAAMAGALAPSYYELDGRGKAELRNIIATAHDRAGGNEKANYGTAVHSLTEPDNAGHIPDRMASDVASYIRELDAHGLEVVSTERFTVNDELKVAGTYDHIVRTTRDITVGEVTIEAGTAMVLDKKTGKAHFDENAIQLASYARGAIYDINTGRRDPIGASHEWGILAHIPAGKGETTLYLIDLTIGYAACKIAAKVREHRSRKDIAVKFAPPVEPVEPAPAVEAPVVAEVVEVEAVVDPVEKAKAEAAEFGRGLDEAEARARAAAQKAIDDRKAEREADAAAEAKVVEQLGAVPVEDEALDWLSQRIDEVTNEDDFAALWREHAKPPASLWTSAHTDRVKRRIAELKAAA